MSDLEFLNTNDLDDRSLALTYGTTYVRGKDGNTLLQRLGRIFEKAHYIREGKVSVLPDTEPDEPEINFVDFDVEELSEALIHFATLATAFEQTSIETH